jgi:hypothetical protein
MIVFSQPEFPGVFFEKTNIPKQIARPGKHGGAYGISRVTSSGLVTTHKM